MLRRLAACLLLAICALPLRAEPADDLLSALRVDDMLAIMREEGLSYGSEMAADMFAGGDNAQWSALVSQIYDTEKMREVVRQHFSAALQGDDLGPLLDYFTSPAGEAVVALELSARRAMVDDGVEQAARDAYVAVQDDDSPRLGQITRFVESNDLIEANVEGALNASFQFYRGLVDGGAFEMSEADILNDVWSQEEETRTDTREWLFGYLLLAYGPMEDADLDDYIALSASEEGRALNRALFAGFNRMYDDVSYALGLAAAQQMKAQEL